jgi:hypothetical protein
MHNTITVKFIQAIVGSDFFFADERRCAKLICKMRLRLMKKGNYPAALKEFRRLAVSGDATAQYNLGMMYHKGPRCCPKISRKLRYGIDMQLSRGMRIALNSLGIFVPVW